MGTSNEVESLKPLTVSSKEFGVSTRDQTSLTKYAGERARILFGSLRTGEANDPDVYVAAIAATLAEYPEDVIMAVTRPSGLPRKGNFLPSVREVYLACEELMRPRREAVARQARIDKQLAERAEFERLRSAAPARVENGNYHRSQA
jgi:hypothetical protein